MSSALHAKRAAIIIGGISAAVVCASALIRWYRKKCLTSDPKSSVLSSKKGISSKSRSSGSSAQVRNNAEVSNELVEDNFPDESIESSSSTEEIEMATAVASFVGGENARGGRRDYRHRRNADETYSKTNGYPSMDRKCPEHSVASKSALSSDQASARKICQTRNLFNDPAIVEASAPIGVGASAWSSQRSDMILENGHRPCASDAEYRGAQLAAEFTAKCQLSTASTCSNHALSNESCDINSETYQNGVHDALSPTGQCIESPSLASDLQSEVSSNF